MQLAYSCDIIISFVFVSVFISVIAHAYFEIRLWAVE
jgi:hypothetical protein